VLQEIALVAHYGPHNKMQLYYEENIAQGILQLSDENAKHVVRVLRMNTYDKIQITDGQGNYCTAIIADTGKHHCNVNINTIENAPEANVKISLAIAFTKNMARIEWMLEKLVEIGIQEIYPLETARGERVNFKKDRLQKIALAAMCQSKQFHAPLIHETTSIEHILSKHNGTKLIAHCIDEQQKNNIADIPNANAFLIFIGPEGDFTTNEIDLCLQKNCTPISLGNTRLRTETAGLVACTLLRNLK
jgi:16S rRNA (uracil1498-N3)-methyltransferase